MALFKILFWNSPTIERIGSKFLVLLLWGFFNNKTTLHGKKKKKEGKKEKGASYRG